MEAILFTYTLKTGKMEAFFERNENFFQYYFDTGLFARVLSDAIQNCAKINVLIK